MFKLLKHMMSLKNIPIEIDPEKSHNGLVYQTLKPEANCLTCYHEYCTEKRKGRYESTGKPLKKCFGYLEIHK